MIFGDRDRVRSAFVSHETQIVLHAAAYKHVPVMEYNCAEAVLNNVFGTRTVAEAALETAAERFLMVSTDKAVNPSSMMGASKRMAELLVQHLAGDQNNGSVTRCACVRFGNVLGSAGSVVPTFLQQIASGGLSEKCSEFGEPQAFASEEYLPPVSRSQASPLLRPASARPRTADKEHR